MECNLCAEKPAKVVIFDIPSGTGVSICYSCAFLTVKEAVEIAKEGHQ